MKHVVSFSTGLSSAITVERVLQRYGRENTTIVFMDTLIEDDDNYRFMADMQKRWPPIVRLCEGRNPYQIARDHQIIPNQKIAPCTFELKIEMFCGWLEAQKFPKAEMNREDTNRLIVAQATGEMTPDEVQHEIDLLSSGVTIHIGYDFTEVHRCGPTEAAYQAEGWLVDFPLLWKPYELRPYSQVAREDWGIEPPRMYGMGFTHANCGGRCVKQGQGDWLRTLINWPDRYAEAEQWEQEMRNHPTRRSFAILRDQSGGKVTPLTLREFRLRYEASQGMQPSLLDYQSPCVYCGVGDFLSAKPSAMEATPC